MFQVVIITYFLAISNTAKASVVGCNTWIDYYVPGRPNCENNADSDKNVSQIIQDRCNASVSEYYLTTEDGYQILLVKASSANNVSTNRNQILLGHGIIMNSLSFVSMGTNSTTCRLLEIYDVWLINFRGTIYSKTHTSLNSTSVAYWNFSFHEMAVYDLKEAIDYIYLKTNQKVIYIGFSMGTTVGWIYQSVLSDEAKEKLLGVISLAPIGYFMSAKTILKSFSFLWPLIKPFVKIVWHGEALQRNSVTLQMSSSGPFEILTSEIAKSLIFGDDLEQMDPKTKGLSNYLNPDSAGYKVIDHYYQWMKNGKLQYYDYGSAGNLVNYNSTDAPFYNVSVISVPNIFMCGDNDWMADTEDAQLLFDEFGESARCSFKSIDQTKWNHVDFVASKCIDTCLNDAVNDALSRIVNEKC